MGHAWGTAGRDLLGRDGMPQANTAPQLANP